MRAAHIQTHAGHAEMTQHMTIAELQALRASAEAKAKKRMPSRSGAKRPTDYEGQTQTKIFNWLAGEEQRGGAFSGLNSVTYHVPNGGQRHAAVAGKLKAQGARAGVVDIFCDIARGGYYGLRIELKADKPHNAELSARQLARMEIMEREGYCVLLCVGYDQAVEALMAYSQWPATVDCPVPMAAEKSALGTDWRTYPVSKERPKARSRKRRSVATR